MSYSDNLNAKQDGVTLRDYNHASRLYINNNLKFAPKQKFLYHSYFSLDPSVGSIVRSLTEKYGTEIGLLVKSADLPRYSAQVETRNKYNRKKNVQTSITYDPITITFHDDNHGVTTALLEAYYRFYYADAWYGNDPGAYSKLDGDNTYKGSARNQYRYGLDNNISVPFFRNIQLTQLARAQYTTYTLVNPIITNWQHDSIDSEGGSAFMTNTITIAYEAVHYTRGTVEVGPDGNPTGYGLVHYDTRPSPLLTQAGNLSETDILATDNRRVVPQTEFNDGEIPYPSRATNPLYSVTSLTETNDNVGGLTNYSFPKSRGVGGTASITNSSSVGITTVSNTVGSASSVNNNPALLNDLAKLLFKEEFLASGGSGGVNGVNTAWDSLSETQKEIFRKQVLESA